MKIYKRLLLLIIGVLLFIPGIVKAATANFNVTSSVNQVVVGNNVTVTVTVSSSSPLGGWEFSLSYDSNYLQLSSKPDKAHGTAIAEAADSGSVKQKSYQYKFKALKSGTTTIQVVSADAYGWDESTMSVSAGSKKLTLKTQAEIEASYSSDAYLKSLGVTNYTLTPEFDKKVNEYSLEVENDVEKVTITASKNDANATVSGAGEKELKEGTNKFDIVVTAQKGNTLTYVVNITRKELNPIEVDLGDKKNFIVRKKADMLTVSSFEETTITYGEEEIPALKNDVLNYTLICLKDEEGNIKPYIYKDGKVVEEYLTISTNNLTILPKSITESQHQLEVVEFVISSKRFSGLAFKKTSRQIVIKGINVVNGEENIYLYDADKNTFIPFSLDDLSMLDDLKNEFDKSKLIIIIMGVVLFLMVILLMIKKPRKEHKNKEDDVEPIEEKKAEKVEVKEEVIEEKKELFEYIEDEPIVEKKSKKKKKGEKAKEEIPVEEIQEEPKEIKLDDQEDGIKLDEIKIEDSSEKSKKNKKNKKKEEIKETKKNDKKIDDDEIDDPLNQADDFVDFWN